jgi:hypothetical protein
LAECGQIAVLASTLTVERRLPLDRDLLANRTGSAESGAQELRPEIHRAL